MRRFSLSADVRGPQLLTEMAEQLKTAVDKFAQLLGDDPLNYEELFLPISEAEAKSAELFYALMTHMRSTFVTTLPREDIYRIARFLNGGTENIVAAADMVRINKTNRLPRQATEQLEILSRQVDLTVKAMGNLDNFNYLEDYWVQSLRMSKRADRAFRFWVSELTSDYRPITYIRQKDIASYMSDAVNEMRQLATHIGVVLVKES